MTAPEGDGTEGDEAATDGGAPPDADVRMHLAAPCRAKASRERRPRLALFLFGGSGGARPHGDKLDVGRGAVSRGKRLSLALGGHGQGFARREEPEADTTRARTRRALSRALVRDGCASVAGSERRKTGRCGIRLQAHRRQKNFENFGAPIAPTEESLRAVRPAASDEIVWGTV